MVHQICMEPLLCYMGIQLWTWSLMLLLSWKSYTAQEVRLKLCSLTNAFTEKAQVMVLWGRSKWYHDRQWFEEWTSLLKRRWPARLLWGNDIQADVVVLKCSLQILAYSSHGKGESMSPPIVPWIQALCWQTAQRKSDPMPLPGLRSEGNCQLLLPVSVGDACARNKPMQHTVSLLP